ncbi:MAG: peptidoglycan editing factor PgeF [Acidobacteria bacterium]|nr:peptidoglycan editing factor PgeF [Acidobacteriota bacterium]
MRQLPAPTPAFHWTHESWGVALRCRPLSAVTQHGFTTRQLALRGGMDVHPAEWASVAALVGVELDQLAGVRQVHGRAVRVLASGKIAAAVLERRPDADAIVSNERGLALVVQVADCVPILLADRFTGVVGAVHAGWRGTAAGIVGEAVTAMRGLGSKPANLVAALGPSIGPCCYEVGEELVTAFLQAGHARAQVDQWFSRVPRCSIVPAGRGGEMQGGEMSLRLDVAAANHDQLVAAGVSAENVHVAGLCTQTHRDVFDSYRADGQTAGRMAAVIRVPN